MVNRVSVDRPPQMNHWQGRIDPEVNSKRWHQVVNAWSGPVENSFTLLGFACDEGVRRNKGRVGASGGPTALRQALAGLAVHDARPLFDAGDIECSDGNLSAAQERLAAAVDQLLAGRHKPLIMGGGHEIAYGTWSGLASHLNAMAPDQHPRIGIINFDAHFDLRDPSEGPSSGTPFAQIANVCEENSWPFRYACLGISQAANTPALFHRAEALGVLFRQDQDLRPDTLSAVRQDLDSFMADCDHVYLTLCLDVFPAATVPGVSAPAARGVNLEVIEPLIQYIAASGKLKVADIAELNPNYDIDQRSARVAARIFHTLKQHWL